MRTENPRSNLLITMTFYLKKIKIGSFYSIVANTWDCKVRRFILKVKSFDCPFRQVIETFQFAPTLQS